MRSPVYVLPRAEQNAKVIAISSMVWGGIAIFAITDKPLRGAIAGAAGAALSLFGIIHSPTVGFALDSSMQFVYSYLMVAAIFADKYMPDKNASLAKLQEKDAKA